MKIGVEIDVEIDVEVDVEIDVEVDVEIDVEIEVEIDRFLGVGSTAKNNCVFGVLPEIGFLQSYA